MATSRNDILINVLDDLYEDPYSRFKWKLNDVLQKEGRKKIPKCQLENMKTTDVVDVMIQFYGDDNAVKLAAEILENIKEVDLAETLKREVQKFNETAELKPQTLSVALQGLKNIHKSFLKEKFECVSECIARPGEQLLLNTVFTKVHVTEGECGELNYHEVREIEKARSRVQPITCNDIFKPSEKNPRIRTVLTKGIAGIGKTFYLQKFILDWATGNNDYGFDFIFVFPFRELNLINEEISLVELVQQDYKHMRGHEDVLLAGSKVLFIFDGLDESRLKLDFTNCKKMCDETKSTVLDDLLINLIKRNLLPSASLWITSRPAATSCIPPRYISRVTEIQGFEDQEKEEYFRKKFKDQTLAEKIISHMRALRSLHVMCYVPAFCRIIATVLGHTLGVNGNKNIPKTLTEVYTNFLLVLLTLQNEKEENKEELLKQNQEAILNLGKLAFLNLERNNLIFYEADLRECGIDIKQSSVYSGVCREIFKEQSVVRDRVYSFVHLTVQEFFAALYVFTSFQNKRHNPLKQILKDTFFDLLGGLLNGSLMDELPGLLFGECLSDVYKRALSKATKSRNGHLDLLVRFLLGLGMETNQKLLKGLLLNTKDNSRDIQKTAEYIKQLIEAHLSPEISINLFHCLCELNDGFLPAEFNVSLTSGCFSTPVLFSTDYSALAYVLETSEAELDTLDLTRQTPLNEGLQRLMPVARLHRRLVLSGCGLTNDCCEDLASALCIRQSSVRELELGWNNLGDSGVKIISAALREPNCKLEKLGLSGCGLTVNCCEDLASILCTNQSTLRELELGGNNLGDSGVKLISATLRYPKCKLEKLG